jgi:hypothetical protein
MDWPVPRLSARRYSYHLVPFRLLFLEMVWMNLKCHPEGGQNAAYPSLMQAAVVRIFGLFCLTPGASSDGGSSSKAYKWWQKTF